MPKFPKTERFDQLTAPPTKGKFYLVWCVRGKWNDTLRDWPVWGPKHDDGKWLNLPAPHYHINRYFVDDERTTYQPLGEYHDGRGYRSNDPLPGAVLRRRKCVTDVPYPFPVWRAFGPHSLWRKMVSAFADAECKRGIGWVCPHKGFDLGSISPDDTGHIRCPLHGLLINSETGRVVSTDKQGRPILDGRQHREMPT